MIKMLESKLDMDPVGEATAHEQRSAVTARGIGRQRMIGVIEDLRCHLRDLTGQNRIPNTALTQSPAE